MDQRTVLIISDDVGFSRSISARWQSERTVPTFTLMKADLCRGLDQSSFDLAVVGAMDNVAVTSVLDALMVAQKPIIIVSENPEPVWERVAGHTGIVVTRMCEGFAENVVLLAGEMLRRADAVARARRAEQANAASERHATIGRYILEMRHSINNALTSVLGNSELLLLEPGVLSAEARLQIEIIRNMALRVNDVMQRLTSIDKEMSAMEKLSSRTEATDTRAQAAS